MDSVSMSKLSKFVITVLFLLLFLTSIAFFLLYLFVGVGDIAGKTATVTQSLYSVFDIFHWEGSNTYKYLLGTGLAILYFVLAILMLKKILRSFSHIGKIASVVKEDIFGEATESAFFSLLDTFESILYEIILFATCCRMIFTYQFSTTVIAMVLGGLGLCVASRVGFSMVKTNDLKGAFYYYFACTGIFYLSLIFLLKSISTITLSSIFNGFSMLPLVWEHFSLPNIFDFLLDDLVQPIAFLMMQIMVLSILRHAFGYVNYFDIEHKKFKAPMVIAIVLVGLCLLVVGYTRKPMFASLQPYLPMLLCSVVLFYSIKIPQIPSSEEQANDLSSQ